MISACLAVLLASSASAAEPAPAASATAAPLMQSTMTVATLYTGDRMRDPFLPATSSGRGGARLAGAEENQGPPTADIHALTLRGMLKDPVADFAIFGAETGETFMLRGGRLYNERNKPVPGITGRINLRQKRVELMTADKDVQTFMIGEKEKAKDEEKRP